jgi:hypothetical protein
MELRTALLCTFLAMCSISCATHAEAPMSRERMESLIARSTRDYQGRPGAVRFTVGTVPMACVSDVDHDRMRIIAPITSRADLDSRVLDLMLVANYHTSLDARYAVSDGVVYAAFLHPLSSLTEAELASALRQVATLAATFGTSYSSGELVFGAPDGESL